MKCQILFSGKNKKNIINLPSAENAQRVVKVKQFTRFFCTYFCQKLTTALLESDGENDCRNYSMIKIHENYLAKLTFKLIIPGSAVRHATISAVAPVYQSPM